jgi:hypothetical protein
MVNEKEGATAGRLCTTDIHDIVMERAGWEEVELMGRRSRAGLRSWMIMEDDKSENARCKDKRSRNKAIFR